MASAPPVRIAAPARIAAGIASSGISASSVSVSSARAAVGADSLQRHLVRRDAEAALAADGPDRPLELLVVEGDEAPAVAAEQVVVVLPAWADALVAGGA